MKASKPFVVKTARSRCSGPATTLSGSISVPDACACSELDVDLCLKALRELLKLEQHWVPKTEGTSLYIRPTMIATEPVLGVKPADEYLFYIILSPVAAYYKGGLKPVKIWVFR